MNAWRLVTGLRPGRLLAPVTVLWVAQGAAVLVGGCASPGGSRVRELTAAYRAEEAERTPEPSAPAESLFAQADTLERAELVRAVLSRNPGLDAARAGWGAALAAVRSETGLRDPSLSYAIAPRSISQEGMRTGQEVVIYQPIPFFGKRSQAGASAAAEAEMAYGDYETMRLDLAAEASKLYDDYYVAERSIALNGDHLALMDQFRSVATERYATGTAMQEEPLKAEVESAHLHHRRLELARMLRVTEARMNALLHRPPDAPFPPAPRTLPLPEAGPPITIPDTTMVFANRPEVAAASARVRGREAEVRLARSASYPDFELMTAYSTMWDDPEHRWMIGAMIDLPIQLGRRSAERERSRARLAQARSEVERAKDTVLLELEAARATLIESAHTVDLYRGRILPASRDQLAASRAGYTSGESPFLNLIDAARNLRDVELEYEETLANFHRARAELDRVTGRLAALEGDVR